MMKFNLKTDLRFGVGVRKQLGDAVKELGGTNVLLVIDPSLKDKYLKEFKTYVDSVASKVEVFDHIDPEPGLKLVEEGRDLAKKMEANLVVGIGGGSAMDTAKAIAVLVNNEGPAENFVGINLTKNPGIPTIMVPSTAGTGSEVTWTGVFINEKTGKKGGINGDHLFPNMALLDPELTLTLPPLVTAYTGMDALAHAMEAFTSKAATVFSDLFAEEAIRLVGKYITVAVKDGQNMEARSSMLLASLYGGTALALAGVGLNHSMAYPLANFQVPHGMANAVLNPYTVKYNQNSLIDKYGKIAKALKPELGGLSDTEAANKTADILKELNKEIGLPASLTELKITEKDIPMMAEIALGVKVPLKNNPREAKLEDIVEVYKEAI